MSNQAKREYLIAIVSRYRLAGKVEKTKILDEFCMVCGYGRKYAIWLLSSDKIESKIVKRERKKKYSEEPLMPHDKFLWFNLQQVSAKRMKRAMDVWLPRYKQEQYDKLDPFVLSAGLKSKLAHFASVLKQSSMTQLGSAIAQSHFLALLM